MLGVILATRKAGVGNIQEIWNLIGASLGKRLSHALVSLI